MDYVIGIDFGTSSVRSILVNAQSGEEIAISEFEYPRWREGLYCNALKNQFRQHPLDYIEGLEFTILELLKQTDKKISDNIRAISIDTTGSTPVAVNEEGIPLSLLPEYKDNPNAMFLLWKDHSALNEAEEINNNAKNLKINFLKYVGGKYSSEWFWAKLLYVLRNDPKVRDACYTWVEHSDWMPFLLSGGQKASEIKRNICAAGHKALWAEEFGGFPPAEYFEGLDPNLSKIRNTLPDKTYHAAEIAGTLSSEWATRLNLSEDIVIGIGALDAHMGAVGSEIKPFFMNKVMGTSTCDMITVPKNNIENKLVNGICGQVSDSIIPGMYGLEAGQSAFGDIYSWYRDLISWPLDNIFPVSYETEDEAKSAKNFAKKRKKSILFELDNEAASLPLEENSEIAVDWLNGRRTPAVNQHVKGAINGLTLGSSAPYVYRSLVEASCFGAKRIVEHFISQGIPIKGIIGVGGVAKKSPFVMQMMADVLGLPIKIHKSSQTSANGASMFAATVAGIYKTVEEAMENMGMGFEECYMPNEKKRDIYNVRYEKYKILCGFIEANLSSRI